MNWKEFVWMTKEKTVLAIVLFLLLGLFFAPVHESKYFTPCTEGVRLECNAPLKFVNILVYNQDYYGSLSYNLRYLIVYFSFSYLAACIFFHVKKKVPK